MNKFFLYLVMLPSALWRGMGADTDQLRAMIHARLTLDDRRPLTFGRQRKQKKDRKYGTWFNMFISCVMGFLYILPIVAIDNPVVGLWVYYSLFMFMLVFLLITDFANVLYDTRDKFILLHRPINDKTLFLARILYVFVYIMRNFLPMALPGWVTMGIVHGWKAAVFFPIPLFCLLFMALFLVNGCYMLILKLASPQKFKEVINYFQIIFAIFLFAFSYLMPRVMESTYFQNIDLHKIKWAVYTPSYWLAALWSWVLPADAISYTKIIATLAILVPVFCLWATIKWIAPTFIRKLVAIDGVDVVVKKPAKVGKSSLYKRLAEMLNSSNSAKAGFIITWLQSSRSRTFRMRVYPTFAYVPIYFIYLLTLGNHSLSNSFTNLADTSKHLGLMYMCSFVMLQALNYLTVSDQYKASWVYYASPLETPGKVMVGAFKAIYIKYFLPFFTAVSIFVIAVWGLRVLLDVVLALTNVTLFASCIMRVSFRRLPFSVMEQMENTGSRTMKVFVSFAICGLLGFGHYAAVDMWWLKLLLLLLSGGLLWLVLDSYANTSWENVKKVEI